MSATISAYSIGVFVHVVAVVVAFGPAFAYPVFASAAERTSARTLPAIHRGIQLSDRWLVTPGMIVVLATGLYAVADAGISLGESWISVGFLAIIVLFAMNHAFLLPRNREALAALERDLDEGGELSDEYLQHMAKIRTGGLVTALIVVVTIFFMVVKP